MPLDSNQKNFWRQTKNLIKMTEPSIVTHLFKIMNFKKRKIRNNLRQISKDLHQQKPENPSTKVHPPLISANQNSLKIATISGGILLIVGLFWITISLIQSLDFSSIIFSFGKDLKTDTAKQTNFLLLGVGGDGHDGSNLTDTIIIASLNEKDKNVKMLSLPRDLYVNEKSTGGQRINKVYDTYLNKYDNSKEALEELSSTISNLTGIPIQYTVKIDFNGFTKIVDALGGVDLVVEKDIYDPQYPKGETIYFEPFSIKAGPQHLDGETALKYARTRHGNSGGDFGRAKRQQQLLAALKEQAISLNVLTDAGKIQAIFNSVADSIETNLTVSEIIELAKVAKDIERDSIHSRLLSDDFTSCGGLLYTPNREYFGNAAVLLPAGKDFDEIKRFAKNYFYGENNSENAPIQVLNGTKTSGLAYNYLNRLSRECLDVIYYGNASNRELENSTIYYLPTISIDGETKDIPSAVKVVQEIINAPAVEGIPEEYLESPKRSPAQIVIELGADYKSLTSKDPFDQLMYTAPIKKEEPIKAEVVPEKPLNSKKPAEVSTSSSTSKPENTNNSTEKNTTPSNN